MDTDTRPTLPVELHKPTVASVEIGQTFYVAPWAMHVDPAGHLWLSAGATRTDSALGTFYLQVTRRPGGFAVDLSEARNRGYQWSASDAADCGVGVDTTEILPVVEITG